MPNLIVMAQTSNLTHSIEKLTSFIDLMQMVCGGNSFPDCFSVGTAVFDCYEGTDCAGLCNGRAAIDSAGVCGSTVRDCDGVCSGNAVRDCATVSGGDGSEDRTQVCQGLSVPEGLAFRTVLRYLNALIGMVSIKNVFCECLRQFDQVCISTEGNVKELRRT